MERMETLKMEDGNILRIENVSSDQNFRTKALEDIAEKKGW